MFSLIVIVDSSFHKQTVSVISGLFVVVWLGFELEISQMV